MSTCEYPTYPLSARDEGKANADKHHTGYVTRLDRDDMVKVIDNPNLLHGAQGFKYKNKREDVTYLSSGGKSITVELMCESVEEAKAFRTELAMFRQRDVRKPYLSSEVMINDVRFFERVKPRSSDEVEVTVYYSRAGCLSLEDHHRFLERSLFFFLESAYKGMGHNLSLE